MAIYLFGFVGNTNFFHTLLTNTQTIASISENNNSNFTKHRTNLQHVFIYLFIHMNIRILSVFQNETFIVFVGNVIF